MEPYFKTLKSIKNVYFGIFLLSTLNSYWTWKMNMENEYLENEYVNVIPIRKSKDKGKLSTTLIFFHTFLTLKGTFINHIRSTE